MTTQNGRAFNEWLRAQLKAKKMSQRQLAQQSGVDHSTISRLIRGDRMPSLGTATKLARGLRELRDDADTPQYLGLVAAGNTNPTARVEYALRADELLSEPQVRQIMEYYLAVRMRRYGRTIPAGRDQHSADRAPARPNGRLSSTASPVGAGIGSTVSTVRPVSRSVNPGTGALLAHIRARPGFALHDPGLGAANAGVWGAGVRDSGAGRGARPVGAPGSARVPSDVPARHAIRTAERGGCRIRTESRQRSEVDHARMSGTRAWQEPSSAGGTPAAGRQSAPPAREKHRRRG